MCVCAVKVRCNSEWKKWVCVYIFVVVVLAVVVVVVVVVVLLLHL